MFDSDVNVCIKLYVRMLAPRIRVIIDWQTSPTLEPGPSTVRLSSPVAG